MEKLQQSTVFNVLTKMPLRPDVIRTVLALVLTPLIMPVFWTSVALVMDKVVLMKPFTFFSFYIVAFAMMIFYGLPVHLIFRRLHGHAGWHFALAGLALSIAFPFWYFRSTIFTYTVSSSILITVSLILSVSLTILGYWVIAVRPWKRDLKQEQENIVSVFE